MNAAFPSSTVDVRQQGRCDFNGLEHKGINKNIGRRPNNRWCVLAVQFLTVIVDGIPNRVWHNKTTENGIYTTTWIHIDTKLNPHFPILVGNPKRPVLPSTATRANAALQAGPGRERAWRYLPCDPRRRGHPRVSVAVSQGARVTRGDGGCDPPGLFWERRARGIKRCHVRFQSAGQRPRFNPALFSIAPMRIAK